MIASAIGKTFLEAFNQKFKLKHTAKSFFDEVFFPCFYNHSKYMQWVTNSPFVQGKKPSLISEETRRERLATLYEKVADGKIDASTAIGYPASELKEFATTSGQVSDLEIDTNEVEVLLTWIGNGFGIGVQGGISIFINHPEVLLKIYEGWENYRRFLNSDALEKLRGNQINTWNGQWLAYTGDKSYKSDFDFADLDQFGAIKSSTSGLEFTTARWSKVLFGVSKLIKDERVNGYMFSYGQMNKTLGFCPIQLQAGRKLIHFYTKLFGQNAALTDAKDYENLFGIHIRQACQIGSLGLRALQPESLTEYFRNDKIPNLKPVQNEEKDK
jgi:hypothetical protein